jgi:DNA polymerase III subunit delta'
MDGPDFTTLGRLVGQARALAQIEKAIASGKLAQSYLFDGPAGVGKHTAAIALCAALNCDGDALGCGRCLSCDKVARDLHPDVIAVYPDGAQIKVEQIRAVTSRLAYAPHEGRTRVIVLDEADRLNPNAGNALLKSLEEPRPHTRFVLVSAAPHRLLPTIRSRCQRVRFAPLEGEVLVGLLRARGVEEAVARDAAALADGSAGRALALVESGEGATEKRRALAARIEQAAAQGSAHAVFAAAAEAGSDREQIAAALALLRASFGARMRREAAQGGTARVLRGRVRAVVRAADALQTNASPQLTLEQLVFELRALPEAPR